MDRICLGLESCHWHVVFDLCYSKAYESGTRWFLFCCIAMVSVPWAQPPNTSKVDAPSRNNVIIFLMTWNESPWGQLNLCIWLHDKNSSCTVRNSCFRFLFNYRMKYCFHRPSKMTADFDKFVEFLDSIFSTYIVVVSSSGVPVQKVLLYPPF